MADKQVVRIGPYADYIASGVRVGNVTTLSGQVAVDDSGQVVGPGDLIAQTKCAYGHVKTVLGEFGARMDDIVDEMWLVTDIQDAMSKLDPLFAARAEAFGGKADTSQTMVQVAALVDPALLIEIKCIAHV